MSENTLVWNVFRENVNANKIEVWNIFRHAGFLVSCRKIFKELGNDREKSEEKIKRELQYYFWCKCEHEVVISEYPPSHRNVELKVDIYSQVVMNWDIFFDYLWNNQALL